MLTSTDRGHAGQFVLQAWTIYAARSWQPFVRSVAATVILALLLSFAGAFGTQAVPFTGRTLYWLLVLLSARASAFVIFYLAKAMGPRLPEWAAAALYLAMATPAITLAVSLITGFVFGMDLRWDAVRGLLGPVFVLTAVNSLLHAMLHRVPYTSRSATSRSRGLAVAEPPALVSRLPVALQAADIHAVSAEDHYLRVFTSEGQALIHMRFMDALKELDGIDGTQTHRSHWVARSAVLGVDRRRGRLHFKIKGNLTVPVSRTFQSALRSNGWL